MADPHFFIVGCGRSGTTLLRSMFNSHPEIAIPLESLFMIDYLKSDVSLSTKIDLVVGEYEIAEWGLTIDKDDLNGITDSTQLISRLHELYRIRDGKSYSGQKTPRFVRHGELLMNAFPKARFVHIVRDPRAVCASLKRSNVHRLSVLDGARRWVRDVSAGLELERQHPDRVIRIHYEDLVQDASQILEKICRFVEVPYDTKMLDYHSDSLQSYGSYYQGAHQLLNAQPQKSRIDNWRDYLSGREVDVIDHVVTKELLDQVGYGIEAKDEKKWLLIAFFKIQKPWLLGLRLIPYLAHRSRYITSVLKRKITLRTVDDLSIY